MDTRNALDLLQKQCLEGNDLLRRPVKGRQSNGEEETATYGFKKCVKCRSSDICLVKEKVHRRPLFKRKVARLE